MLSCSQALLPLNELRRDQKIVFEEKELKEILTVVHKDTCHSLIVAVCFGSLAATLQPKGERRARVRLCLSSRHSG